MYKQILLVFVALQLSTSSQTVIFQNDESVIEPDSVKGSLGYSYYEVVPGEVLDKSNILPADIVEIAKAKLGIKNPDRIPTVSELGDLLGTTTREETIDTIRELIATESGIDLIKAFIASSDYADNTIEKEPVLVEAETARPPLPTSLISETIQKDLDIAQKVITTPKPELSFFQRITSYLGYLDLFPENNEIPISPVNKEVQQLTPPSTRSYNKHHHESHHQRRPKLQPISIAHYVPDSFPVPFMPNSRLLVQAPPHYGAHPININNLNRPYFL